MTKPIPINERKGHLTIICEGPHQLIGVRKIRTVQCRCDCGNIHCQPFAKWRRAPTASCGCQRYKSVAIKKRTHGESYNPIYAVWSSMRQRCENPKNKRWNRYGARGIKVCERWKSFSNFLTDMGTPPAGLTLDRFPNNDGNYERENCRWATASEQATNKSSNFLITALGVTKTLSEWAKASGIHWGTIRDRVVDGWRPDDAVTLPPDNSRRYKARHMDRMETR